MTNTQKELYDAIKEAVTYATNQMGLEEFKKLPFFLVSSQRKTKND